MCNAQLPLTPLSVMAIDHPLHGLKSPFASSRHKRKKYYILCLSQGAKCIQVGNKVGFKSKKTCQFLEQPMSFSWSLDSGICLGERNLQSLKEEAMPHHPPLARSAGGAPQNNFYVRE